MSTGPITTAQKVRALPWYYSGQGANVVFILLTWFGPILLLFLAFQRFFIEGMTAGAIKG